MSKPKIGFIGLGLMGGAMVSRLQDQGYNVTVLGNRDRTELDKAIARGATEAANARDVAEACDVVMLCVGTSDQVEGRMRGPDGVIAGLSAGKTVIDFGTSLPASTRALGAEVADTGAAMMDAPIGRTPQQALIGKLNLMCAGERATFDAMQPVLQDLAENLFFLGDLGAGHTVKLINNFFAQTVATAMAEAFVMADVAGVERQAVYDVMSKGPGHSPMMDFIRNYAVDNDSSAMAFAIKNASKDLGYYRRMAEDAGVPSIMSASAAEALSAAADTYLAEENVPVMVEHFARVMKG
ncbi:MAG: NAD(P)-dependent oxidoreductase [Pseudomonadota bacterium]